jgi:multidrug resistance efflux pump
MASRDTGWETGTPPHQPAAHGAGAPRFPWEDRRGAEAPMPHFGRRPGRRPAQADREPPPRSLGAAAVSDPGPEPTPPVEPRRPATPRAAEAVPPRPAIPRTVPPRWHAWRSRATALLHRLHPPGREELRAHWPAYLLRAATYSGAILLAGSLLLATLPPILSDTSSRAVVNAPVVLVTAPIDGEVEGFEAATGMAIGAGQVLAMMRNDRLDRSTLIGLQNQTDGTRLALAALSERIGVAERWIGQIDTTLTAQRDHALRMAGEAEREARARAAAAAAIAAEQQQLADRQRRLLERGVVSESVLRVAELRARAAAEELVAARATLARRSAERLSIEGGSYVGEGQAALGALVERRRDAVLDLNRMRVELHQLTASLAGLELQTAEEQRRIQRRLAAEVIAPASGHVLRAFASPGQRLAAGDSIAGTVECGRSFVVAIFSVRQAHRLALGTRVSITSDGWPEARGGTVVQVMPRTTDRVDTGYAVPFPPMERREMYVLVEFDDFGPRRWARGFGASYAPGVPCDIGRWVHVEIEGGMFSGFARTATRIGRALLGAGPAAGPLEARL